MIAEGRIVGQNTDRIVINFQTALHLFQNDTFRFIADHPVQLCNGKIRRQRDIRNIQAGEDLPEFRNRSVKPQKVREQFIGAQIEFILLSGIEMGVLGKVQARDGQPLFIGRLRVERIVVLHGRHADHGVFSVDRGTVFQRKAVISRCDDNLFVEPVFQIEIPPEIVVFCFEINAGTHKEFLS